MKTLPVLRERRTCNGACCAVFSWPIEYDPEKTEDGPFIADMLIRLTDDEAVARAEKFGGAVLEWATEREGRERAPHTCRHWDEQTRLCTVYDRRPVMCRNYPYDGACTLGHECGYTVAPVVQACYRIGRLWGSLNTKKEPWDIIVGDPLADVLVRSHKPHYGKGTTKCGLNLERARVVRRTKRIVACHGCWPEVYAK